MSYLDKRVLLKANLETRSIKEEKQSEIFFYNTDENIANLYMKLIYVTDDGLSKELQKDEVSGYSLKMTAIKPKTNQIREVDGVLSEDLINNEGTCAIFKFQLETEFTNQIGDVICCTKIIKDAQKLNMDYFVYTIKADKLTGLNAEIESNPDLPVLKQLIKEVKELQTNGGTTGNHTHNNKITLDKITEEKVTSWDNKAEIKHEHSDYLKEHQDLTNYQTKIDKNITAEDKSIVNNINNLNAQFNTTAKDLLLEDGKLYLKKNDGGKIGTGVILPVSGSGGSVTWESLTGKPTTFEPSGHRHNASEIDDLPSGESVGQWRLISDITTTEEIKELNISKDINDNNFELEELLIETTLSCMAESSNMLIMSINNTRCLTNASDFIGKKGTKHNNMINIVKKGNYLLCFSKTAKQFSPASFNQCYLSTSYLESKITSMKFEFNFQTLEIGSIFKIYGR